MSTLFRPYTPALESQGHRFDPCTAHKATAFTGRILSATLGEGSHPLSASDNLCRLSPVRFGLGLFSFNTKHLRPFGAGGVAR